jgi:hypothetical protein
MSAEAAATVRGEAVPNRVLEDHSLGRSEECGCPEETFLYKGVEVTLHEEPDGSSHAILLAGDWNHELFMQGTDLAVSRERVLGWIDALPPES